MRVALGSIVRNGEKYCLRYAAQIACLKAFVPEHEFRSIIATGDNEDATYDLLKGHFGDAVFLREHGGPKFGSTGEPERMRQHAFCWEAVLERLTPEDDVFVYLTADLIWDPAVMRRCLERLGEPQVDMVAPFLFYQGRFYDTWAVKGMDGVSYGYFPPHHREMLEPSVNGLYQLSSAGSFIVMKAEIARTIHFDPPEMEVVSFTRNAVKAGWRLWLDPALKVYHPQ
jgi:GT2 family glycosyltransferase